MDFSCDRCGRRYFVPDDLVHGRVFRAKCDDCSHAFDVVAPDTGAAAVPAVHARSVKIALSDDDVSRLVEAASSVPTPAPFLVAARGAMAVAMAAPVGESTPAPVPERTPGPVAEPTPAPLAMARLGRVPVGRAAPSAVSAAEPPPPAVFGGAAANVLASLPLGAEEELVQVEEVLEEAPQEERAPARRPEAARAAPRARPAREEDAGGKTEEFVIAAGARHRHRRPVLALVGAVAVCVAAGVLVSRFVRLPGTSARARAAAAERSWSGSVPLDASGLAARPQSAAPERRVKSSGGVASRPPRRRMVARRLDDRQLLDLLARKDDVAMDRPSDDVSLDSAKGVLDPVAVERTVGGSRRAFDACITRVLRFNPGFRVPGKRATIIVTVEPTGKVNGASIGEEQVEGTELGRCLVTAASRMTFPRFDGEAIDVAIPLSLSAIQ